MSSAPTTLTIGRQHWPLPLLIALFAFAAVVATLDSSGAVPQLGEGPGLTFDETFNVQMGVYHVRSVMEYGLALFHPDSLQEVFGNPAYNPDHPPLGRILLGVAHELTDPLFDPDVSANSVCVTCGRVGSAFVYAVTVFLVCWITSRWSGHSAGVIAALAMLLMPRMFAHGHIASLETTVNLTYLATILWVADRWSNASPPTWRRVVVGGILFGLCLLSKMQAVLLPIPIAVWACYRWRWRALIPIVIFGVTGLVAFFAGWPWLWLDPVVNVKEYFGRATERQTLYCWYQNHKWADVDVPWHYPLVMFAVTVPVGLQLLGLIGAASQCVSLMRREADLGVNAFDDAPTRSPWGLLLLNVVWPLILFVLPGVTVYDGTRLFLMIFPMWAMFIGVGGARLMDVISSRWSRHIALAGMSLLLAAQSYGVVRMHPLGLSYYNALTGGLRGAVALGFEPTYWGDSVTRTLLNEVGETMADRGPLYVAPTLHRFQLKELQSQSPSLRRNDVVLLPYDDSSGAEMSTVLVIGRRADAWDSLTPEPAGQVLAEVVRGGVRLSAVYELSQQEAGEVPTAPLRDD